MCAGLLSLTLSAVSNAAILTASDTDDDATLTLNIEDTLVLGVNQQWRTLQIVVDDVHEPFTTGDTVALSLWEDDGPSNDLLFQTSFTVSTAEITVGLVNRSFALIFTPEPDDGTSTADIFAEGLVNKDACGLFCTFDNPVTSIIDVELVDPVPIPATIWLFGSSILGFIGFARRKRFA